MAISPATDGSRMSSVELAPLSIKRFDDVKSVPSAGCARHGTTLPSTCCPTCWSKHFSCCPSGLDVVAVCSLTIAVITEGSSGIRLS